MSLDYICLLLCATMTTIVVGLLALLAKRIAEKLEPLRRAHRDADGKVS